MLYPASIEEKLGFDTVRDTIDQYCQSDLGRVLLVQITFLTSKNEVDRLLTLVGELREGFVSHKLPEYPLFHDLNPLIEQLKIGGAYLQALDFVRISATLCASDILNNFFRSSHEEFPLMANESTDVVSHHSLVESINRAIANDGVVKNNASAGLRKIRHDILSEESKLRTIIKKSFRSAQEKKYTPEAAGIVMRGGRMVIPILAAHKRQIKGFILDESSSGQTIYLEPAEALESNNRIRELELAEKKEIIIILLGLSDLLYQVQFEVERSLQFLALFDFTLAKAKLAISLKSVIPEVIESGTSMLRNAVHPQMLLTEKKSDRTIVPLNISFTSESRIILLSGPNAGGKSVCLKTVGINQYMLQCGIVPAVRADSIFKLFNDLFIDIGDEQSIENDLSTYSSHLKNMQMMLEHANDGSLILVDEFGSGTDPQFGAAIAEAMLNNFLKSKVFGLITTHYGSLKEFAETNAGISNAAMLFDTDKLEPLYELEIGRPGSSFALEIALKTGIPGDIIKHAKKSIGHNTIKAENLLNKLESQKIEMSSRIKKLAKKEKAVAGLKDKYINLKSDIDSRKSSILENARSDANELLAETNKLIENTIRHIKENKAGAKETKKARKKLDSFRQQLKSNKPEQPKSIHSIVEGILEVGDYAIKDGSDAVLEVIEIKGKEAKVLLGELQSYVKLSKLHKVALTSVMTRKLSNPRMGKSLNLEQKSVNFSTTLDIRGYRAEEAIESVARFVDDALLLGHKHIRVLHGKGNGVLRIVVRQQLKEYSFITSVSDEQEEQGGAGVSVINLG